MSDLTREEATRLVHTASDDLNMGLGRRLAVDDETVAGGLYAIAKAIHSFELGITVAISDLTDAIAATKPKDTP